MKIDIETSPVDDSIETNNAEEKTKNIFHKIWTYLKSINFNILEVLPRRSSRAIAYITLILFSLFFIVCRFDSDLYIFLFCLLAVYIGYLMVVNNFYSFPFIIPIIFKLSHSYELKYPYLDNSRGITITLSQILLYISLIALLISIFRENKHNDTKANQNSRNTPPLKMFIMFCLMYCGYAFFAAYISSSMVTCMDCYCNSFLPRVWSRSESKFGVMKPIIYLYPENKTEVSVELGNAYKISHSYPKYEKMWNVVVDSNSNILYNGRNYYGLYWEGKGSVNFDMNDGFVVKGSDSAKFLEEKLSILGLNEREANEFIIYWLPKLESNAYNFIKFASIETQNEYMPLSISPKPDTVIRVLMGYKGLNKKIEVKEQILPHKPERNGFVAVEWGGTEIGDSFVY